MVKTTTFGAFVNLVPGRDGLVHISKLGKGKRLQQRRGGREGRRHADELVEDIDTQGKISLKPVGEEWAIPEGQADESGGGRDRGNRGGGRDRGDRGGRDRDRRRPRPAVTAGDAPRPALPATTRAVVRATPAAADAPADAPAGE